MNLSHVITHLELAAAQKAGNPEMASQFRDALAILRAVPDDFTLEELGLDRGPEDSAAAAADADVAHAIALLRGDADVEGAPADG